MIYIEKNDKPNIIEKMLNLIKVQDSTIILPINEKNKRKTNRENSKKNNKSNRKNIKIVKR